MFGPYRILLSQKAAFLILLTKALIFLPEVALIIPLTLLIQAQTGSYTSASVAIALYALPTLFSGPYFARLANRLDSARLFYLLGFIHSMAFVLAIFLLDRIGFGIPFLACLVMAGLFLPPVMTYIRHAWQALADKTSFPDKTDGSLIAHGLENSTTEALFILGPALASVAIFLDRITEFLYLIALSSFLAVNVWYFLERKHIQFQKGQEQIKLRILLHRVWPLLVIATLWVGAWVATELTAVATANAAGSAYWAGIWMSATAVGSLVGGLLYGIFGGARLRLEISLGLLSMNVLIAIPWLGPSHPWIVLALITLSSVFNAAAFAALFVCIDRSFSVHDRPGAYAILGSAFGLGVVIAPIPIGYLLDHTSILLAYSVLIIPTTIIASLIRLPSKSS